MQTAQLPLLWVPGSKEQNGRRGGLLPRLPGQRETEARKQADDVK